MLTLWEAAERKPCSICGKAFRVWDYMEAESRGEDIFAAFHSKEDFINPSYPGFETVCNKCKGEEIDFRYRVSRTEYYESKGAPIPKWIWNQ